MSAGFTPGPWHLCQHLKGVAEDAACGCGYRGVIYGPDDDKAICQPGHERPLREEEWGSEPGRYPRETEIANARLIAAAPDLLNACEAMQQRITEAMVLERVSPAQALEEMEAIITAAIAKARGEA